DGSPGFCAENHVCCTAPCASDQCSTATCNVTGACLRDVHGGRSCDDGNLCTHTDTCSPQGNCAGTAITCTSNPNACVTLSCNGTATCASAPRTTGSCNDGNVCTHTDTCNGQGNCVGTAIACTNDACAMRACNGTNACTVTPVAGPCDDGN